MLLLTITIAHAVGPTVVLSGETELFGNPMAFLGDVNGDGLGDILVGEGPNGRLYFGQSDGSLVAEGDAVVGSASGYRSEPMSRAGDLNGDGFSDALLADLSYDGYRGAVSVHLGGAHGLAAEPGAVISGTEPYQMLGITMAAGRDLDGDGVPDAVLGAPFREAGEVHLYIGGTEAGMATVPLSILLPEAEDESYFGEELETGDVDGDGLADVLIGASTLGSGLRVWLDSSATAGSVASQSILLPEHGRYGFGVLRQLKYAEDVDGDGYGDIVASASYAWDDEYGFGEQEGVAYVFLGGEPGLETYPSITLGSRTDTDFWVESLGDVDADGKGDLLLSDDGIRDSFAWIMLGDEVGGGEPAVEITADEYRFGFPLAAGDMDGDGIHEVAIGAYGAVGRVYLYRGDALLDLSLGAEDDTGESGVGAGEPEGDVKGSGCGCQQGSLSVLLMVALPASRRRVRKLSSS